LMIFIPFSTEKSTIPCSCSASFAPPNLLHPLNLIYTSLIPWQLSKWPWPIQTSHIPCAKSHMPCPLVGSVWFRGFCDCIVTCPLSAVFNCLFNIFAATLHIWRPFLHPQPEDAPCRGDRDPFITV
jgi:hypothetical protein